MRDNVMKARLRRGEALAGAFVNIAHPSLVEILGILGMDFVILDGEHTGLTPETAEVLIRAAELQGMTPIARVGENDPQVIQKFLESGAQGVLIPLIRSADDARRVVEAVKYPPIGRRGLAGSRASDWGLSSGGLAEHVRISNEEAFIAVQVETQEAIAHFEEIVAVEFLDLVFFGPSDLSATLGVPGQTSHPEVITLIERLGGEALGAGKAAGTIARTGQDAHRWRERGFQWLCTGVSNLFAGGVRDYLEEIQRPSEL